MTSSRWCCGQDAPAACGFLKVETEGGDVKVEPNHESCPRCCGSWRGMKRSIPSCPDPFLPSEEGEGVLEEEGGT